MTIGGVTVPKDGTVYTFATTDFTNNGGDSYTMLADGQGATRDRDANAFLSYLQTLGGVLDPASYRSIGSPACRHRAAPL